MINLLRQHIISRLGEEPANIEEVLSRFIPGKAKCDDQLLRPVRGQV